MLKEIRQETVVKSGGVIEVTSADFPVGASVEVIVLVDEKREPSSDMPDDSEKWARFYENVVGVWKGDEEINQIFEEIDRNQHQDLGRETPIFNE